MKNYAKLSARAALTGNYTEPAASVIIMLIVVLSLVLINQISAKLQFLPITLPLSVLIMTISLSILKFLMSARLLRISEKTPFGIKLSKSRIIKGSLLTACVSVLKLLHFTAFICVPVLFFAAVYSRVRFSFVSIVSLIINVAGIAVLFLLSFVFYGVSVQKYSKAIYYFAGSPSVSVRNAISMSIAGTRGNLLRIFSFKMSFFPWFISGVFLLPLMFVLPYYEESFIFYCMYSRK